MQAHIYEITDHDRVVRVSLKTADGSPEDANALWTATVFVHGTYDGEPPAWRQLCHRTGRGLAYMREEAMVYAAELIGNDAAWLQDDAEAGGPYLVPTSPRLH
jgi:hypothetical protein